MVEIWFNHIRHTIIRFMLFVSLRDIDFFEKYKLYHIICNTFSYIL